MPPASASSTKPTRCSRTRRSAPNTTSFIISENKIDGVSCQPARKPKTISSSSRISRLTVLEALHAKRRLEPGGDGMPVQELEALTGRPREHLEFTVWYLAQKKLVQRDDSARLLITADGVDFLEQNYRSNQQRRRLQGASATASAGA